MIFLQLSEQHKIVIDDLLPHELSELLLILLDSHPDYCLI